MKMKTSLKYYNTRMRCGFSGYDVEMNVQSSQSVGKGSAYRKKALMHWSKIKLCLSWA